MRVYLQAVRESLLTVRQRGSTYREGLLTERVYLQAVREGLLTERVYLQAIREGLLTGCQRESTYRPSERVYLQ